MKDHLAKNVGRGRARTAVPAALACAMLLGLPAFFKAAEGAETSDDRIDYNRDIRPILADKCYACHGPDSSHRESGLRLDRSESALKERSSGKAALVPGSRARSGLFRRITTRKPDDRMPPAESGKTLTAAEIELLGRWIDQGAPWTAHWAYVPPSRPALPKVRDRAWPRNPIDFFILAQLEKAGLTPCPEADRATLIRRLSFDLIGLPPTLPEVDAFLNDNEPDAYEKVVDRLLASPQYGERMAVHWLDLARYADTNGYRLDNHRDMWHYRDWVINAFNRNMPFDQFTIEQLAGDLLPGATQAQRIATGFQRNTMVNFGNGSDPKEYLAKAVTDRVSTTATVWLGTTLACAQCHDHKYDPFTSKDFYRFYAFFNNVPEKGLDGERRNPVPTLLMPSRAQDRRLKSLRRQLAEDDERPTEEYDRLKQAEQDLLDAIPSAMVMEEMAEPRVTHILKRGDYLSEGAVVLPGVPASLPPLHSDWPADRLGLARWLVDPTHPLTSRVTMNRFWQMIFGTGIVRTVDDFGSQGETPSHPELLDWLATKFIDRHWDVKAMQKLIVMSATYRQSSGGNESLWARDPSNRLLARGPRFRLDAEMIRDNALALSGLLECKVGGPSVRPYQPAGLWEQVSLGGNYSSQAYVQGHGADLCRRGLYVYWKRSLPYPALAIFDATNRELCTALRPRTNTPLQALVLMNDPTFVEAARALAQRIITDGGADNRKRLSYAFRLCTGRQATEQELTILARVYRQHLSRYRADQTAAEQLMHVGESPCPACCVCELAAWTMIASMLLNLDETVTKG
jgi:hypothetical protein